MFDPSVLLEFDPFIVSDTHFGHKNIIKYCNRPMDHESRMIKAWNSAVGEDDYVLHLGDVAVWYGPNEDYWLSVAGETLPGKKFLIRGNHDKRFDKVYKRVGFNMIPEFIAEIDGRRILFSHYPDVDRLGQWDINIHGHIHNSGYPEVINKNRDYRNVSMEVMDYSPVRFSEILHGKRYESSRTAGTWVPRKD